MWQAVADAATGRRAWSVIDEIERHLVAHLTSSSAADPAGPSMPDGGDVGLVLFFAYLEAARPGSGAAERALDLLGRYIDSLSESEVSPALYGGFCGLGWVTEHLVRRLCDEGGDLTEEIDAALRALLEGPDTIRNYELIRGLSGFGTYLLERLPHPDGYALLGRILDHLEASVEDSAAGCTWWTPPKPQFPQGCYNLGVAHGVPGVLGFLAEARRAGITDPRVVPLAEGAVRWLLAQRLQQGGDSAFPAYIVPGEPPQPTRTAWCYGDLGVAAVLLSAARSFERPDWESEALALAHLAARRSLEAVRSVDCSLCHGAAGISHIFSRMYQATGDAVLKANALAWLERTLAMQRPGEGFAGFVTWVPTPPNGGSWRGEPGFLVGAAGVGLALLAAVTDVEPAWDRLLLTSVPPRPAAERAAP